MFALAGIPAQAQWNMYGNGPTFYVPFTNPNIQSTTESRYVSLSLNTATGPKATHFLVDTGSLGIVAGTNNYRFVQGSGDLNLGAGGITYTTSGTSPSGTIYLTNVTINGANGQTATTRVPILAASDANSAQMGIGFDRGGLQLNSGAALPNLNPFFSLTAINGQAVGNMAPGYIIGFGGLNVGGQSYAPGIMLGLTQQNTSGYSFVQLTPQGGLPAGCSTTGMGCPLNWNSQAGSVAVNGTGVGPMNLLPDSGIGYMIINSPNAGLTLGTNTCSAGQGTANNCLPNGAVVQVFLPGQTQAAASYQFTVNSTGSVSQPFGVEVNQGPNVSPFTNVGRAFFSAFNYVYDPINGFVGYSPTGIPGTTTTLIPLLALQGNLAMPNGFAATSMTYLMSNLNVTQTGSGTFSGNIFGPGGLTLQSGGLTLGGGNTYGGGTVVNGGTLTIGSTGSITGNLTVNPGGSFVNNGTVDTPGVWQASQGTFTNNGAFLGNLANVGTATNSGTLTGSVINGAAGSFANNGTVTGNVVNMGTWSGSGSHVGSLANSGVISPGNSIGTTTVAGNFSQSSTGTFLTEVAGAGLSDRINVGGTATVGGQVLVTALPGMSFAPSTTYTILSAAGGLSGAFASVNELYPFLQSTLSYDANNAYLNLAIGGFAGAAATPTQAAVGNVLDANVNNATGDFATVLGAMAFNTFGNTQAQATLQAISGNNYAGFSSSMVQGAQLFMNNFANQTGGGGSPVSNRVALAEACDVACDVTTSPKWGAWGGALGGLGTIGANQSVGSVTYNAGGFAAGLDRTITDAFRMGVTAGYTTGTQWVSGFDGMGRSNTFQVGLYGGFARDKVYADALIGYAYTSNQMWRNITVPGLQPRTANGLTGANQWYGQVETGYRFDLGTNANAFITPFARLQAYTASQNAFTETGAQSLNLSVAQQQTNSLRSVIGAQIGGSMDLGWREKLLMQLRLGWSHEYADTARPVTATLAGAPAMPFTTFGVAPQRDGVVLGLSANTAIAEATSIYLRYEGDISGQDSAHALTAGVRMTW